MRRIPKETESLRLLAFYLNMLRKHEALATPELQRLVIAHVYDLAVLTIGAGRDAAAVAKGRGAAAARMHAIKADIAENLSCRDLSVAGVAARQRITPRYVQMLFEAEGVTFSEYVLRQRLVCAHRMLTSPRCVGRTISAIAFESGFSDLSYFNRAFRRSYGATPSDIRFGRSAGEG